MRQSTARRLGSIRRRRLVVLGPRRLGWYLVVASHRRRHSVVRIPCRGSCRARLVRVAVDVRTRRVVARVRLLGRVDERLGGVRVALGRVGGLLGGIRVAGFVGRIGGDLVVAAQGLLLALEERLAVVGLCRGVVWSPVPSWLLHVLHVRLQNARRVVAGVHRGRRCAGRAFGRRVVGAGRFVVAGLGGAVRRRIFGVLEGLCSKLLGAQFCHVRRRGGGLALGFFDRRRRRDDLVVVGVVRVLRSRRRSARRRRRNDRSRSRSARRGRRRGRGSLARRGSPPFGVRFGQRRRCVLGVCDDVGEVRETPGRVENFLFVGHVHVQSLQHFIKLKSLVPRRVAVQPRRIALRQSQA
mmetsp:Transcript_31683/g.106729  ORF Transcript_31683/g.106729 Transcript_31683/m.106729 type:complete len:354 (+) Transcript_31683:47-1108(+)